MNQPFTLACVSLLWEFIPDAILLKPACVIKSAPSLGGTLKVEHGAVLQVEGQEPADENIAYSIIQVPLASAISKIKCTQCFVYDRYFWPVMRNIDGINLLFFLSFLFYWIGTTDTDQFNIFDELMFCFSSRFSIVNRLTIGVSSNLRGIGGKSSSDQDSRSSSEKGRNDN